MESKQWDATSSLIGSSPILSWCWQKIQRKCWSLYMTKLKKVVFLEWQFGDNQSWTIYTQDLLKSPSPPGLTSQRLGLIPISTRKQIYWQPKWDGAVWWNGNNYLYCLAPDPIFMKNTFKQQQKICLRWVRNRSNLCEKNSWSRSQS